MTVIATTTVHGRTTSPRSLLAAGTLALVAVLWFTWLSGWLGVAPGSVLTRRQNVLFNSDTNVWIDEMVNKREPSASIKVVHPLDVFLWRPPCQVLYGLFRVFVSREYAGLLAARLLVALIAGLGVGCMALLALRNGTPLPQCILLLCMYLLFTSSTTTALPEHFGISNGLLTIAFATPLLTPNRRLRVRLLTVFVPLSGGTTLTNGLYPLSSLYQFGTTSARVRRAVLCAVAVSAALALFLLIDSRNVVLNYTDADKDIASRVAILPAHIPAVTRWYLKSTGLHIHIGDYLNFRWFHDPLSAAAYGVHALVSPAVGPPPSIRVANGSAMVTYESAEPLRWDPNGFFRGVDGFRLSDYFGLHAMGAILWMVLLLRCAYWALRDHETRRYAWLPLGWILFNIILHNMWGDELFLYSPHWSWALLAMIVLGSRHLSLQTTASMIIPIMVFQAQSLFEIKNALTAILR